MNERSKKTRAHLALLAAAASVCCAMALTTTPAHAATIDELQAQVDQATQAYNDATTKVSELQAQIEECQAKIEEVNGSLPEKQQRAASSMSAAYKMQQSTPGLVTMLLSADTFSDFLTSFQYLTCITRSNDDAVQELVNMEKELASAQETLESAKEEADAQQKQAQASLESAQSSLIQLNAQLAAQAAAEAAAKAAEEAATQAETSTESGQAATSASESSSSSSSSNDSSSSSNSSTNSGTTSNPSATDGTEVATDGEWMIGYASAYSLADNTGGNATASGEILTDDSMTVAVPLSQRYLLGRTVQIRYGGKTVTATVNDVGGFAKYGRVLDLAGGVWKSFGFNSPTAWGVRAVQYRFL